MINIYEFLKDYNLNISKITYLNNYIIVECVNKKYLLKTRDSNKKELFNFLDSIDYNYYLPLINNYNDSFELYFYYDDKVSDYYMKAKELVFAFSLLHLKTTSFVNYDKDKIKEIYENKIKEIDNIMNYYLDLQDYIEQLNCFTPAYYLLLKNISKFYKLLRFSRQKLDLWYADNSGKFREALLINNVCLDNFRFGDVSYFIDYKNASKSLVIYDFVNFYRSELLNVDMVSLFDFYNSNYKFNDSELKLFYSLICIPEKVFFTKNNYNDTILVRKIVDYVDITLKFLKENKENEETDKDKFEE